jgi:hypothetical protein
MKRIERENPKPIRDYDFCMGAFIAKNVHSLREASELVRFAIGKVVH